MLTIDELKRTVDTAQREGRISGENYWVYIALSENACYVSQEEDPRTGYVGYFCEDESRLNGIHTIAERKAKRCK